MEGLIAQAGIVIPVASLLASAVNQYIRGCQEKGEAVPAWLLHASGILNVCALNGDKAMQMIKLAKSLKASK